MDDDERAELARQGRTLVERAEQVSPAALGEKVKKAAGGVARDAVLGGMAVLNDLTGGDASEARARPSPEAIERAHARLDAADVAEYDERLARAASRFVRARAAAAAEPDGEAQAEVRLARLRRSFPPESRELATLIFACVDLLEDLADASPPSDEELRKTEHLLGRIATLLVPHAGPALESFVAHVTDLSRERRG